MSLATPCPAPLSRSRIPDESRRLSTASWVDSQQDDTCTANIDYTRAFESTFRQPPSRRPRRPGKKDIGVAIFEDVAGDDELVVDQAKLWAGKTLLSKPARRVPGRVIAKPATKTETTQPQPLGDIRQGRVQRPVGPQVQQAIASPLQRTDAANAGAREDARRRTIFVPSDDTTMLTIHPGANTTNRLEDTFQLPGYNAHTPTLLSKEAMDSVIEDHIPARRPRMSMAAAPKRAPLQGLSSKTNNLPSVDVLGQNGGKENVPPGREGQESSPEKPPKKVVVRIPAQKSLLAARTKLYEPTAASQARQTVVARKAVPLERKRETVWQPAGDEQKKAARKSIPSSRPAGSSPITENRTAARRSPMHQHHDPIQTTVRPATKRATPPKRSPGQSFAKWRLQQYPILSEDIAQPQLYDDSWLIHQEIALTELINELFDNAHPSRHQWGAPGRSLRERMLELYHQPSVGTLHTRLKASLLYGALSQPKDMPSPPDPTHDIGLRKRFLNLWLHTYDEDALRAAAEVVVGRQVGQTERSSMDGGLAASESVLDPARSRRALIGFLETFLVTVEDLDGPNGKLEEGGKETRRWRKTILRSLMLIWLLDQAKTTDVVSGCLFKRTSTHKTSASILHALSDLLIPSIGDVTRPLRHLDYAVTHSQDPLDEVRYHISNIATGLRDGVFLTRLVEILLFSERRARDEAEHDGCGDATMTLQLPDTTIIQSALYANDGRLCRRLLSQYIKMPCLGRAQKLYNVQIALSALAEHGRHTAGAVADMTADDVVDGHREKTLSLLWALLCTHGLAQLVDWDELAKDVARATGDAASRDGPQEQHQDLLKAWAGAYCAKRDVHVSNLTTSFASGKAYEAILDAFADFLPPFPGRSKQCSLRDSTPLRNRLQALGCSTAFIKQLTTRQSAIPSNQTTISNLAFLASRLLPLARRHNAAITIQHAYRARLARNTITRRVASARLASACAVVVRTQQRLEHSATVLQRAWRNVLDTRISRLNGDVKVFQMLARGWSVRRGTKRSLARRMDGDQSLRGVDHW